MQPLVSTVLLVLFFFFGVLDTRHIPTKIDLQDVVTKTITVDKLKGGGNFQSVQQAIDSIPSNNKVWTRIQINRGTYVEKVEIPRDKPFIILQGGGSSRQHFPVIEFADGGNVVTSPTFKLYADNFVARNIIFKNSYNPVLHQPIDDSSTKITQAPAASIAGDKASFYNCSFLSVQDTLTDALGRHYFYDCYIKGETDFIWGNGQSIYENCQINSTGAGYITAQGRDRETEPTGYVFKNCNIFGKGPTYLGRPYRLYSRVLFFGTRMDNIINPEGWNGVWSHGHYNLTTYSEVNCNGPGADLSHRVPWMKKLSDEEVKYFTNTASFINQDGWLEKQPN